MRTFDEYNYAWENKLTEFQVHARIHAHAHTVTFSRNGGEMYPHIRVVIRQLDTNVGRRET